MDASSVGVTVVRVPIYVRAGASAAGVGGEFDDHLVVRVIEPAHAGKATAAALKAVANSFGVPRRSVKLLRGHGSQRKLVTVTVAASKASEIERELLALRRRG